MHVSDYVAPICLPQKDDQLKGVRIGELVTAAGWGKMNMTTEERAEILQVVAVSEKNILITEKPKAFLINRASFDGD